LKPAGATGAKTADAVKSAVAILVILGLAALFGARLLKTFGVSLDAFSVAGGFVLAWMVFTVAVAVTLPVMLLISIFGSKTQSGFVRETVTHLMGLMVIAMGFQFALNGIKAFMA
jgi:small neutral amino acid transporter SnatA (MarC family)